MDKHRPDAETRAANRRALELMSLYMNIFSDAVSFETLNGTARELGVSRERAAAECVAALTGLGSDRREQRFFESMIVPQFHELNAADFYCDPFYRNVKIPDKRSGSWELRTQQLAPGELFACGDFIVSDSGAVLPQIGFFADAFDYPAVLEHGREWMTLMPNETLTTRPAVSSAFGRVVTYGLGLGYFAYMASEKPEVESVTVVELSRDAIKLFKAEILPQFPYKEKITIVEGDALEYAKNGVDCDFVFADIWHDAGDGCAPYKALKALERPGVRYAYWLEDTILCYINGYFD